MSNDSLYCPHCGNKERFVITALHDVIVDGNEEVVEYADHSLEWDDNSLCVCYNCGEPDILRHFRDRSGGE